MNLMPAPDLPAGIEWFNTDHPLSIRELAGRIVLLYFGTFACSNCMRLMPDLRRLMEEHPEMVVIGVHAPGTPGRRSPVPVSGTRSLSTTTTCSGRPSTSGAGRRSPSSTREVTSSGRWPGKGSIAGSVQRSTG